MTDSGSARVPSVAKEDDRRLRRLRDRLIAERGQHVNRIKGLCAIRRIDHLHEFVSRPNLRIKRRLLRSSSGSGLISLCALVIVLQLLRRLLHMKQSGQFHLHRARKQDAVSLFLPQMTSQGPVVQTLHDSAAWSRRVLR
jgi:hypothetical protein